MEAKISASIGFSIIILVIIPMSIICYRSWLQFEEATSGQINTVMAATENISISSAEKRKIDVWIIKNNLNEFGDPKGTVYAGGTPLFSEATGKKIDKYQYILDKHPNKPWNNM
jgi:hypothetical protein